MPLLTGTGGIIHGDNWNCIGVCRRGPGSGLGLFGVCPRSGQCREKWGPVCWPTTRKFSQILILQIIPGTQGLYGLVAWFFALMKLGFFSGELRVLTGSEGLMFLAACLPMAIGACCPPLPRESVQRPAWPWCPSGQRNCPRRLSWPLWWSSMPFCVCWHPS